MRFLSTLLLLGFFATANGQCYRCGMFGMLMDNHDEVYVARFTTQLDSITLESALDCEIIKAKVTVEEVSRGLRKTKLFLRIEHAKFNGAPYRIKYPTGAWGMVNGEPGYW